MNYKRGLHGEYLQSKKRPKVITMTKTSNEGKKSLGDTMLQQNKPRSARRSILKPNKKLCQNSQPKKQEKLKLGPRDDLPKFLSMNYKRGPHRKHLQSKKRQRVIITTKKSSDGKKSSGDNKPISAHRSILKPNKRRCQNSLLKKQEKFEPGLKEDLPKFLSMNCKRSLHGEYPLLKKRPRVITTTKSSSDGKKSSEDTIQRQDKPTSTHRSVLKSSKKHCEEEESAKEDPTLDEYHNMTGNEEDDKGRPKSTNESMRINPFADFPNHVELEQQADCSKFLLMQVRDGTCLMKFTTLQNSYMIRLLSEQRPWWFL